MSAKVVVIGAGGLVGARLCRKLVELKEINVGPNTVLPLAKLVLFDKNEPTALDDVVKGDARVTIEQGDLCDMETIRKILLPDGCTRVTVMHLAALLSGYSEDNFDLGMKINLFGTINVIECVRELTEPLGGPQIYMYVSTDYVAMFNDYNKTHPVTEESFRLSPVSYGVQKACNELLISDYTRKGFIDGRVSRLSAVIGRPGWSNSISYPYTGIFTQPLEGKDYEVPLPMDVPYPCSALNNNVDGLLFMSTKVDADEIGHNRVVQIPCKSYNLNMIWEACQKVAAEEGITLGKVKQVAAGKGTTTVTEINVCPDVSCEKAAKLGLPMEVDLEEIIRDYIANHIKK
jgi:nucleoside-diphosphate-sugar epimerase